MKAAAAALLPCFVPLYRVVKELRKKHSGMFSIRVVERQRSTGSNLRHEVWKEYYEGAYITPQVFRLSPIYNFPSSQGLPILPTVFTQPLSSKHLSYALSSATCLCV